MLVSKLQEESRTYQIQLWLGSTILSRRTTGHTVPSKCFMSASIGKEQAAAQAYERALQRAVKRIKQRDKEVHALDVGTGAALSKTLPWHGHGLIRRLPGLRAVSYGADRSAKMDGDQVLRRVCTLHHAASSLATLPSTAGALHCTGSGLLAVLAARAGADTVVACDLHEPLAAVARRVRPRPDVAGVSAAGWLSLHTLARTDCIGMVAVISSEV